MNAGALVQDWLRSGFDRTAGHSLQRKILHVNAAALMVFVLLLPYDLAYLLSRNSALYIAAITQLPVQLVAPFIPWLNRRGRFVAARWLLLGTTTSMIVAAMVFSSGTHLDIHFLFIALAVSSLILFPLDAWRSISVLVLVNCGLFLFGEVVDVAPPAALLDLPRSTDEAFRASYVLIALVTLLVIVWLGEFFTREKERALEVLSGIDSLTGLANRRRVHERLVDAIATSTRIKEYVAVVFLDLDNFKSLNDRHGHEAGDLLLREAARRLDAGVRKMDLAGRLGGDEFVAVLTHLGGDRDEAVVRVGAATESLRRRLAEPYYMVPVHPGGRQAPIEHHCTASIGVALFRGAEVDPDTILKRADAAMYQAKTRGRNQVWFEELPR